MSKLLASPGTIFLLHMYSCYHTVSIVYSLHVYSVVFKCGIFRLLGFWGRRFFFTELPYYSGCVCIVFPHQSILVCITGQYLPTYLLSLSLTPLHIAYIEMSYALFLLCLVTSIR